jgi:membrane protein required for colicin V production
MPFQLLDLILIGIMLVSGLLALMRGFTREVLTLVAWGGAAVAAYFAIQQQALLDLVQPYIDKPMIAKVAVGAGVFIIVLILISIISVKISDAVVDSAVGAFDRSLGFVYGLARGFILVVIAYLFYGWLLTEDRQEDWVRNAMSLPAIKYAGGVMLDFMPADIADTLNNTALIRNPEKTTVAPADPAKDPGYQSNDTQGLDNLIEGSGNGTGGQQGTGTEQKPTFGQGNEQ